MRSIDSAGVDEHQHANRDFLITRRTLRGVIPSGVLWGAVFGFFVTTSALSYASVYKTPADRNALAAAFEANVSTGALFGPGHQLNTVAGYTVFDIWLTVAIMGAVWGLLISTKLLRGEEDAGRWELLLTGQATRKNATVQALLGLLGGVVIMWIFTAVITVVTGQTTQLDASVRPALYFAVALISSALMFVGIGGLTSQLASTRRQASAYAGWVLGASYALRMVADSGTGLHWLIWASPLGWVEQLQPLTSPMPIALVPIFAFTVAISLASVYLAERRDVGAGTFRERSHAKPHLSLLSGHVGLAVRLIRPVITSWGVAITVTGLLIGYIAYEAGETLAKSSMNSVYERLGAAGAGIKVFLGVSFLIMAVIVCFVAIGQMTAARSEEAGGRLDNLLAGPVSRIRWMLGRLAIAVLLLVFFGLLSGFTTWLGVVVESSKVGLGTLLAAGLNVVAPAICILGVTALALGAMPRATSVVGYALMSWSLLIEFVGGIGAMNRWLFDTSLFHQMSAAPAVNPNITSDFWMVAIGVVSAAIGCVYFSRRDIIGK